MSFIGNLLYHHYYKHRPDKKVVKSYGGKSRYTEMLKCEAEMRQYALNSLVINKPFERNAKYSLNFLTGEKFIHQSLFCVYSLFRFLTEEEAREYSVTFFDDSTLSQDTLSLLKSKFSNITVVDFESATAALELKLPKEKFSCIHKKSAQVAHFNKLFFPHTFGEAGFKVFLDSDMLFFKRPEKFITWLGQNSKLDNAFVIEDIEQNYGYTAEVQEKLAGKPTDHALNVGFYGLHTDNIDFEKVERMINDMDSNYKKNYYAEQFVTAVLLSDQKNLTVLPKDEYIVFPSDEQVDLELGVLHHYVDISKFGYFTRAWKNITKPSAVH